MVRAVDAKGSQVTSAVGHTQRPTQVPDSVYLGQIERAEQTHTSPCSEGRMGVWGGGGGAQQRGSVRGCGATTHCNDNSSKGRVFLDDVLCLREVYALVLQVHHGGCTALRVEQRVPRRAHQHRHVVYGHGKASAAQCNGREKLNTREKQLQSPQGARTNTATASNKAKNSSGATTGAQE